MDRNLRRAKKAIKPFLGKHYAPNAHQLNEALKAAVKAYRLKPGKPLYSFRPMIDEDGKVNGIRAEVTILW